MKFINPNIRPGLMSVIYSMESLTIMMNSPRDLGSTKSRRERIHDGYGH